LWHLQKLAGVHTSKPLKLSQLSPYVPCTWLTKAALIILWFLAGCLWVESSVQAEGLT
jgi:hypothetical protein